MTNLRAVSSIDTLEHLEGLLKDHAQHEVGHLELRDLLTRHLFQRNVSLATQLCLHSCLKQPYVRHEALHVLQRAASPQLRHALRRSQQRLHLITCIQHLLLRLQSVKTAPMQSR
jgi:hypothetical protein